MKKWQKRLLVALGVVALVVVVAVGGVRGYAATHTYSSSASASKSAQAAVATDYGLLFAAASAQDGAAAGAGADAAGAGSADSSANVPDASSPNPTVIFYPGAFVQPESYSVWASQVAAAGYAVAIVSFPLNLAVLKGDAAARVSVGEGGYVIGGHSLGGVMASRYAAAHPSRRLKGVYFMASYPDAAGSLSGTSLPVLSLTGSRDGVLEWDKWRDAKRYLPAEALYRQLKGGNHAGFGSYGVQKGDTTATVSDAVQQKWVAEQMVSWLEELR